MKLFPKDFQTSLRMQLAAVYDAQEAAAVAARYVQDRFQLSTAQLLLNEEIVLSEQEDAALQHDVQQLLAQVPVQQVVGFEIFCGYRFRVTRDTLIPRPETEDLVRLATEKCCGALSKILDVGTGTGCIAISLAKALPLASVAAWDISEAALQVAQENAANLSARVDFQQQDLLKVATDLQQMRENAAAIALAAPLAPQSLDAIVSNPPYIPEEEAATMEHQVVHHEPHTALFVPNDDPLLFYRALAQLGWHALRPSGALLVETHTDFATAVATLFESMGYSSVRVHRDCFDRPRLVEAVWE